jgi:hypothetical protein
VLIGSVSSYLLSCRGCSSVKLLLSINNKGCTTRSSAATG